MRVKVIDYRHRAHGPIELLPSPPVYWPLVAAIALLWALFIAAMVML